MRKRVFSCIYVLLVPYLCFISFLYLELYVLEDDTSKSIGIFHANPSSMIGIRNKGEAGTVKHVEALQYFLLTIPRRCFFCGSFCYLCVCVCLSYCLVCSLQLFLATCWERGDILSLLFVMFSCVFVTFLNGVLGQICYLIVSIHDLCLLPYFGCFTFSMGAFLWLCQA